MVVQLDIQAGIARTVRGPMYGFMPIVLDWSSRADRESFDPASSFSGVAVFLPHILYCDLALQSELYNVPRVLSLAALYRACPDLLQQAYTAAQQIKATYIHFARFESVEQPYSVRGRKGDTVFCIGTFRPRPDEILEQFGVRVGDVKRLLAPVWRLLCRHAAAAQGIEEELPRDVVDEILGWL